MNSKFLTLTAYEQYSILPKFEEYFKAHFVQGDVKNSVEKEVIPTTVKNKSCNTRTEEIRRKQSTGGDNVIQGNKKEEKLRSSKDQYKKEIGTEGSSTSEDNRAKVPGSHLRSPHTTESKILPGKRTANAVIATESNFQCNRKGSTLSRDSVSPLPTPIVKNSTQSGIASIPNLPYPRFSLLTRYDHLKYMEYFLSRTGRGPAKAVNMGLIQRIERILSQEHAEFQAFLQGFATANPQEYNFIPKELYTRIKVELLSQINLIKMKYKSNYILCRAFSFPQIPVTAKGPLMSRVKTLVGKAEINVFRFPMIGERLSLPESIPIFHHPQNTTERRNEIEKVLQDMDAQVYFPAATLLTLVTNHGPHFMEEWRIPFRVVADGKAGKRIIFDDVLQGGRLSTRTAYRWAMKTAMSGKCASSYRRRVADVFDSCAKSHANESLASNTEVKHGGEVLTAEDNKTASRSIKETAVSLWPVLSRSTNEIEHFDNAAGSRSLYFDRWKLGQFSIVTEMSNRDTMFCGDYTITEQPYFVVPYAKIEHQLEQGFEKFSVSELCQLWWTMFLCQPSKSLCFRIDSKTGMIKDTRYYTMTDLTGPGSPFNPITSNKLLHDLLRVILDLSPGEYLMKHETGSVNAIIYEELTGPAPSEEMIYNLGQDIEACITKDWPIDPNRMEWLPLDPWLPLERHINAMQIPCTFPINPNDNASRPQKRGGGKNKSKKNKKKKTSVSNTPPVGPAPYDDTFF